MKTYYDILGVQKQATPAELKKAFLLRCKLLHPDRFNQTTQKAEWDLANEMFKELNQAYDVLKNPLSRNQYDYKIGSENRPQSAYTAPPPPRTTPPPARPPKPSSAEPPPIPKNYPSANSSEQLKGCGPIALVLIIGAFNKVSSPTIVNVENPLSDNEKKHIVRDPETIAVQSQISELIRKIDQENDITKKEGLQKQKDDLIRVYQDSRGIKVALKPTPSPTPKSAFTAFPEITTNIPLKNTMQKGYGKLKIKNGSPADAVVKLIDDVEDKTVFIVYIKSKSDYQISSIPDGVYRLIAATGQGWNYLEGKFVDNQGSFAFDVPFIYETIKKQKGDGLHTYYNTCEVTLNRVKGGNAETAYITESDFDKY